MSLEEKLLLLMAAYIISGDLDPQAALKNARAAHDALQQHLKEPMRAQWRQKQQ